MIIGHQKANYAEKRNVIGRVPGFTYTEMENSAAGIAYRFNTINKRLGTEFFPAFELDNVFYSRNTKNVDCVHLVNGIGVGAMPWISSFETVIPRFRASLCHAGASPSFDLARKSFLIDFALRAIAHRNCKAIISLSSNAARIQQALLAEFPRLFDIIEKKLTVLHPPQLAQFDSIDQKPVRNDGMLRLMLVGGSFFRKGGREILEALHYLREEKKFRQLHLTMVSSLAIDAYASGETEADVKTAELFIAQNKSWIEWFPHLPNEEVIRLMKSCDIGLLPTYADTYGYSVLEFQACACPVISTDVRALTEINPVQAGWQLSVPVNQFGEAIYHTSGDRKRISQLITQGLVEVISEIIDNPGLIKAKATESLLRICNLHNPSQHGDKLRFLYSKQ